MCARHVVSVQGGPQSRRAVCCCGWTGEEHLGADAVPHALTEATGHHVEQRRKRRALAPEQVRRLRDTAALISHCASMSADLHGPDGQSLGRLSPHLAEVLVKSLYGASDLIRKYGDAAMLPVQIDMDLAELVLGPPNGDTGG